jgi:hypothetical protein
MATREYHVEFTNRATATPPGAPSPVGVMLRKTYDDLCHGSWTTPAPDVINPSETVQFGSDSSGVMTGTVGIVKYDLISADARQAPLGKLCMVWNNPFAFATTEQDLLVSNSEIKNDGCDIVHESASFGDNPTGFEVLGQMNGRGFSTGGWEALELIPTPPLALAPFISGPLILFGVGEPTPHAFLTVLFRNIPGNLRRRERLMNVDPSHGIRPTVEAAVKPPARISLRHVIGLRTI